MTTTKTTHLIIRAIPKENAADRQSYKDLSMRPCIVLQAEKGHCARFCVEMLGDPGVLHRMRTSTVRRKVDDYHDHESYKLETENAVYYIAEAPDNKRFDCQISDDDELLIEGS